MLEQLLKLYTMAMATGVTSPMPHIVGPPGSGKSTMFKQLAELLGVNLHVVNVSRISPLGLEGFEMPSKDNTSLKLLISELWTKAKPGDIYLFDEFLRGFPEVYNGLLDIFTGREVAGFVMPEVFIAGASNSTATYDKALEDRVLHIPVPDPRKRKAEKKRLAGLIVDQLGLMPGMVESYSMESLLDKEVLPTFNMLDGFGGKGPRNSVASAEGTSVRKLIGQAQLRHVTVGELTDLIEDNNNAAIAEAKFQYVFLLNGKHVPKGYESAAQEIKDSPKLTAIQRLNLELNLQLIELEKAKHQENGDTHADA